MQLEPQTRHTRQSKINKDIYKIKSPIQELQSIPQNTLDEGILDTLKRQVKSVCYKFGYVLLPQASHDGTRRLRQWDLWGPFVMAILFILVINNAESFLALLGTIFFGAAIVSFNIKILGGQASFFQCFAILGYCSFPVFMCLMIVHFLKLIQVKSALVKFIIILIGVLWSVLSTRAFISVNLPADRKFVAIFPIFLFFVLIGVLLFQL